jgi:hypothetical protein
MDTDENNQVVLQHKIPDDIKQAYNLYTMLNSDLSDLMQGEVNEWLSELKADIRRWKAGGKEPDWQGFRDWSNEMTRDDGLPDLFG